jgi:hypothetical protein
MPGGPVSIGQPTISLSGRPAISSVWQLSGLLSQRQLGADYGARRLAAGPAGRDCDRAAQVYGALAHRVQTQPRGSVGADAAAVVTYLGDEYTRGSLAGDAAVASRANPDRC